MLCFAGGNFYGRFARTQVYGGTSEQLRSYKINISPPKDVWVQVDTENGIYFKQV